jgi:hypothetical protein
LLPNTFALGVRASTYELGAGGREGYNSVHNPWENTFPEILLRDLRKKSLPIPASVEIGFP